MNAVIEMEAGIGDCVHLEPVLRQALASGYDQVHLFCRMDAVGLYQHYDGVCDHPMRARQLMETMCRQGARYVSLGAQQHHAVGLHRALQYASAVCPALEIPPMHEGSLEAPRLPVTPQEVLQGRRYYRAADDQRRVLFQVDAYRTSKSLTEEKAREILRLLLAEGYSVVCIARSPMSFAEFPQVRFAKRLNIRGLMAVAAAADVTLAMDSAPSWISLAVGTRTVSLFGATDPGLFAYRHENCNVLYEPNAPCTLCAGNVCYNTLCLDSIPAGRIMEVIRGKAAPLGFMDARMRVGFGATVTRDKMPVFLEPEPAPEPVHYEADGNREPRSIALLRLDGLGGTMTLSDHARKLKAKYPDASITLIIRHFAELFRGNPNVDNVISVGEANWGRTLLAFMAQFDALADIRFAVARWYGESRICEGSFYPGLYESFPIGQGVLGQLGLHHIQLTNMQLGLPAEEIETELYFYPEHFDFDGEYVVISTGVDTWHKGLVQTKCWPWWPDLVPMMDLPVVQVGTEYDKPIPGVIDMRGHTNIFQLSGIIRGAKGVIVTEGGIAHLARAESYKSIIVLRGPTANPLLRYPGQLCIDAVPCRNCMFTKPDWFASCPMGMVSPVCMRSITPERVIIAYENMVSGQRP